MAVTREQIDVALFALLDAAVGAVVQLTTSSRKWRDLQNVDPAQMPALFLMKVPEMYERAPGGLQGIPPKRTAKYTVWLYTGDAQEDSVVPITQLNEMVDAIETAMLPQPGPDLAQNRNTLGQIVWSARIEGDRIEFYPNMLGDGRNVAIIPISVLRP